MTVHLLPWPDHLDALEEWLRRTRAALEGGGEDTVGDLPEPVSLPDGLLPEALRLRAEAAMQALQAVEQLGLRRRDALQRSQAYSRY